MTTILLYGNKDFCSISADTQATNQETLQAYNGLVKVVKVNSNVIIAISGSSEAFVKLFGWNDVTFPTKRRPFKQFFNENFTYKYADDCFEMLANYVKNNIESENKIFVVGRTVNKEMFYGMINTKPYNDTTEIVKDRAVIMYGDLPHDLDREKNKNRYEEYMRSSLSSIEISSQLESVIDYQKSFIQEISFESNFSNSEVNNATITI